MGLRPFAGVGDLLPAAAHNFLTLPRIRSESPAFDLHHPEVSAIDQLENVGHGEKTLAGGKEAGK